MSQAFIIGITGGSGSGKTTFIRALEQRMEDVPVCILSQDEYYKDRTEQQIDELGIYNFDLPSALDEQAFIRDVYRLRRGERVVREEYTYNNPDRKPDVIEYEPAPVIVLEGLYVLLNSSLRDLIDLKVFIHAKENIKVIRRIKRDREERNYPLEDVLYRYENHVMPSYEQYIKPFYNKADLVINNNESFQMALQVLCGFLYHQIDRTSEETLDLVGEEREV